MRESIQTHPHSMNNRLPADLRCDALAIWQAGVAAVQPQRLVPAVLAVEENALRIGDESLLLNSVGRILVVGGGKAGAAMAVAVEQALGDAVCQSKRLTGLVSVPADAVAPSPEYIHLHVGRAAGVNEPSPEGVRGADEMLRLVAELKPNDLCLCLISGGGSALLPAPANGVTLADKLALTQRLSAAGANIGQLNTVRKQLSRIKGGRLAAACNAGRMVSLIISDVIGDPLGLIASGPTVPDDTTAQDALAVLDAFELRRSETAPSAIAHLERRAAEPPRRESEQKTCRVTNLLIGNLAMAVNAAAAEASRRGYLAATATALKLEGPAEDVGRDLAQQAIVMRGAAGANCLISGGEPTVVLVDPALRGRGGRNQQLALAAGEVLLQANASGCLILSGGTDGEDGPTDAAGAWVDLELMDHATQRGLSPADYLARNDAYTFFDLASGLLRTGATQTNVGDLRVVLVGPR